MISWSGQSTDLRIKSTILLRPARRITTILTSRIMLAKQKQLGMELIKCYRERKTWLSRQNWLLVTRRYYWPWDPPVKLGAVWVKGEGLHLFWDYPSARTQVTVLNNANSETSFIHCGVPQGSVFSPLLLLLYINDFPNFNLLSDVRMYADDTNLMYASKNPEELFSSLSHNLSDLKQWLDSNHLSLNVLKTKCLFTGTRHKISWLPSEQHICLDGHSVEESILTNA